MLELATYIVMFIALSGLMAMVEAAVLSVTRGEVGELLLQRKRGAVALHSICSASRVRSSSWSYSPTPSTFSAPSWPARKPSSSTGMPESGC